MANEVLYRKWRPRRFSEVSGQDIVMQTLRQAVAQQRLAHAYLFCGPRGTGKTSTARIFAKAINCLSPKNGEPDATCAICKGIDEGRALDLIEIDAASNRRVEDARSLRERVFGSGPAEGKFKVYIIDEVHMLTDDAFDTLLKTLEEPPSWAIFILCTTEAHKVMPTIISRCQRFDFRRITTADTAARLEVIATGEKITVDPIALQAISRSAGGSLRDACNLLEQLTAAYGKEVRKENVEELLGLRGSEQALPLVVHVLAKEAAQALGLINVAAGSGMDLRVLQREVVEYLRAALLLKSGVGESLEMTRDVVDELKKAADKVPAEHLLRTIRIFAQANVKSTEGVPSLPLELAVVEACAARVMQHVEAAPTASSAAQAVPSNVVQIPPRFPAAQPRPNGGQPAGGRPGAGGYPPRQNGAPGARPGAPTQPARTAPAAQPPAQRPPAPVAQEPARPVRNTPNSPEWDALYKALRLVKGKRFTLGALLLDCTEHRIEGQNLVLVFRNSTNMERLREEIEQPDVRASVQQAVKAAFAKDYEVKLVAGNGGTTQASQPQGHLVRAAINLGSRIIDDSSQD